MLHFSDLSSYLCVFGVLCITLGIISNNSPALAQEEKDVVLLATDFESEMWHAIPRDADNKVLARYPTRTNETARSGNYSLASTGGVWESPRFPVTPFAYYAIEFYAKITPTDSWAGHWSANFYDTNGKMLIDHYSYIDASDEWQHYDFRFRAKAHAAHATLRFHPKNLFDTLYIDDLIVRTATRDDVRIWADRYYALAPPVRYTPSPDRWLLLPRTHARLQQGGPFRIVMLGDSIINDIGNSPFDVLVERQYPRAQLEVVTSVRGSTGCEYYQLKNRVSSYVLQYQPELVIIGGISNESAEAVRHVIRQIRAAQAVEILVMTGAVSGEYNPRIQEDWSFAPDPQGAGMRSQLMRMAAEEQVAFLDLAGAWGQYMLGVDQPYAWFQRDRIHANERGRAVLARVLAAFFSPNNAVPLAVANDRSSDDQAHRE